MNNNSKVLSWLRPFLVCTVIFMCAMLLLKVVVGLAQYDACDITFLRLMTSLADSAVVVGFLSILVFLVYTIFRIFSEKLSIVVISIVFAFLLILEVSLTIFTMKSGALMDNEIFLRPLNEVIETMQSGVENLWLILVGFAVFVVAYCWLMTAFVNKLILRDKMVIIGMAIIVLLASLVCLVPRIEDTTNPNVRNFVTNKTLYLIRTSISSDTLVDCEVKYDKSMMDEYAEMHPYRTYPDETYPMEFVDDTKDNLSQFFKDSDVKPNIVVLIVESLGAEWMGTNATVLPLMTFVDSLANHSLYWENCISTTLRSFGAVPSLTGSVPCGIRGYQFGNMPSANTLFGILKSNGYETNAYYSGQFSFDCIAEYLISQKIDYMSEFYKDYEADTDKNKGCFWGYHDEFLFDKSIKDLENKKAPMLNLFVTITTHDDINDDNPYFAKAIAKTKYIVEETRKVKRVKNSEYNKAVTFVYTDDCLRKFFDDYSKRDDFANTIFIVTGDHPSGFYISSDISRYHVPLIIYSPLLKEAKKFNNIVTHNDLVPSLVALLKNKYNLQTPEKVSWAGNCLGIDNGDSNSEMLFVEYAKGVTKLLSNGYIYVNNEDRTYRITDDMRLYDASDTPYHDSIKRKFDIYKYVNDYVYLNNKLVSESIFDDDDYKSIFHYNHSGVIECHTSTDGSWVNYYLMPKKEISGEWSKIKISFSADVSFLDEIEADKSMDLYFYCSGENHHYPAYYTDKIVKFFAVDKIVVGEWYRLNVEKEFVVKDASDLNCYIYTYYSKWMESNRALFKNVKISVMGVAD